MDLVSEANEIKTTQKQWALLRKFEVPKEKTFRTKKNKPKIRIQKFSESGLNHIDCSERLVEIFPSTYNLQKKKKKKKYLYI